MKLVFALFVACALFCSTAHASPASGYTLYYLDKSHNVCEIRLDSAGKPAGKPRRLTSLGGYDDYSVSPGAEYVVGFRRIGETKKEDTDLALAVWKCYLEVVGGKPFTSPLRTSTSRGPSANQTIWSPTGSYVVLIAGIFDVEGGAIFSTRTAEEVSSFADMCGPISRDERLAITHVYGDEGIESSVLDLQSGRKAAIENAEWESVWIGDSHKLAWTDWAGRVWVGEAKISGSQVSVVDRRLLHEGDCSDLRYIPGKGLYFTARLGERETAYYSTDLTTVHKGDILLHHPPRPSPYDAVRDRPGLWTAYARYSPDQRFIACPVDRGHNKIPEIVLGRESGDSLAVVSGKVPTWEACQDIWESWTPY